MYDFKGKNTIRDYGDAKRALFLGTEKPLCSMVGVWVNRFAGSRDCDVKVEIDGRSYAGSGKIKASFCLYHALGKGDEMTLEQIFQVGETDLFKALVANEGKESRLCLRVRRWVNEG